VFYGIERPQSILLKLTKGGTTQTNQTRVTDEVPCQFISLKCKSKHKIKQLRSYGNTTGIWNTFYRLYFCECPSIFCHGKRKDNHDTGWQIEALAIAPLIVLLVVSGQRTLIV